MGEPKTKAERAVSGMLTFKHSQAFFFFNSSYLFICGDIASVITVTFSARSSTRGHRTILEIQGGSNRRGNLPRYVFFKERRAHV